MRRANYLICFRLGDAGLDPRGRKSVPTTVHSRPSASGLTTNVRPVVERRQGEVASTSRCLVRFRLPGMNNSTPRSASPTPSSHVESVDTERLAAMQLANEARNGYPQALMLIRLHSDSPPSEHTTERGHREPRIWPSAAERS